MTSFNTRRTLSSRRRRVTARPSCAAPVSSTFTTRRSAPARDPGKCPATARIINVRRRWNTYERRWVVRAEVRRPTLKVIAMTATRRTPEVSIVLLLNLFPQVFNVGWFFRWFASKHPSDAALRPIIPSLSSCVWCCDPPQLRSSFPSLTWHLNHHHSCFTHTFFFSFVLHIHATDKGTMHYWWWRCGLRIFHFCWKWIRQLADDLC